MNLDLNEIRKKLDGIDQELTELFEERMKVCAEVAEFKIETGKKVYDAEREKQKLEAVKELAHGEFNKQGVYELFSQIMTISRRYQYKLLEKHGKQVSLGFEPVNGFVHNGKKVVYQGVEGAYSHAATMKYFGENVDAYHVTSFEEAMQAVENGEADFAVLPIENSSAGAVTDNYDLLTKYDNVIIGEVFLEISHALLGIPGATIDDIKYVYSHPQALMQCSEYLNSHKEWEKMSFENTAVAAKKVVDDADVTQAAVASETAAKLYGLNILKSGINHNKNNTTRFIVVSKEKKYSKEASKISMCFELPHKSGSLYNMLGHFIFNGINMLKIESRPIIGRNWEYRFFVDIEGNLSDESVKNALLSISEETENLKILGNY